MNEIRSTAPEIANFTGGNNIYCNLQSRVALVDALTKDQHSIYRTVESCRSACELFYGTGNPDISGVGVSISYIFQVGVTYLLFTVILACRSYVNHPPRSAGFSKQVERVLNELVPVTDAILATNLFLTLSLAAGTLVELNKYPFVFTLSFLRTLTIIEPLITAAALLCRIALKSYSKANKGTVLTYLFAIFTLIILWIFIYFRYGVSDDHLNTYKGVVYACADHRNYPRYSVDPQLESKDLVTILKFLGFILIVAGAMLAIAAGSAVLFGLLLPALKWAFRPLKRFISSLFPRDEDKPFTQVASTSPGRFAQLGAGYLSKIFDFLTRHRPRSSILSHAAVIKSMQLTMSAFMALHACLRKGLDGLAGALKALHSLRKKGALQATFKQNLESLIRMSAPLLVPCKALPWWVHMLANAFFLPSILICTWAIPLTRDLEIKRLVVARASQDKFEDNVWGFGQVVAVLLWVPVVFQLMSSSIMFLRHRRRKADEEQAEHESVVDKDHVNEEPQEATDHPNGSGVESISGCGSGSEPSLKEPILPRKLRSHGTWPLMDDERSCDR